MFRAILSVIVGYIVMAVFIAMCFTVMWIVLGRDFAFLEGTTEVTMGWTVTALVASVLAALFGGMVAAGIARTKTPVKVLAGIVLVLGLLQAFLYMGQGEQGAEEVTAGEVVVEDEATGETEEIAFWEAAQIAESPTWYNFAIPFIGLVGVLAGGCLIKKSGIIEEGPIEDVE
jgi:ABC-type antimicrobial peptide transport system permease subunit